MDTDSKDLQFEINRIIDKTAKVLDFLENYLQSTNDNEQSKEHENFIYIFIKVRFNLDSILMLMQNLVQDNRFKVSLNVLYRSIIDDLININYLLCFVVVEDHNQQSLDNELSIMHKEFLMSTEELLFAEKDFQNTFNLSGRTSIENSDYYESAINDLYVNNILITEDIIKRKWKKNSEIRRTTNTEITLLFPEKLKKQSTFISEGAKLAFIKARNFKSADLLKLTYKYLSQYQHYSPIAHKFLLEEITYDISCYKNTLVLILQTVGTSNQVLKVNDNLKAEKELFELVEYLAN